MPPSIRIRTRVRGVPGGVAVAVVAMAGLVLALGAARHGRPFGWELALDDGLAPLRDTALTPAAHVLTQLGAGPVLFPLLALACWWTAATGERRTIRTHAPVALLAAGQVLESVLLAPLLRVGPEVAQMPLLSVGSGHTAGAVLGWGLLARQLRSTRWSAATVRAQLTVPPLVALTRVLLGEHWAVDVLVGLAVGSVLLVAAATLLDRLPDRRRLEHREPTTPLEWWRTSRWAWTAPAAAALVCLVPALLAPRDRWFGDLLVYAGSGGSAGSGQDVYAYRTMFGLPFTYPPFAAVLAEPLSRVPWPLLQALWCAATLPAAVAIARSVLRPVVARIGLPLTTAALLVSSPLRSHVRFGQVGVFLVLLVAVDLLQRRRPGIGLGLAVAVKLTPAVFLPWLVVVGARRHLRTTLLCAGGATLAGLLLLWPSAPDYLLRALWDSSRFGANDIPGNQSVRGMLLRSPLGDHAVGAVWLAAAALLLLVGIRNAARLEREGNRLGAVAVMACLSVAVSPISWVHHLVWLTFAVAALVAAGRERLAVAWWAVLVVSLPSLGAGLLSSAPALGPLWTLVVDLQGATAVAAVLFLPRLLRNRAEPQGSELTSSRDSTSGSSPSVTTVSRFVARVTAT